METVDLKIIVFIYSLSLVGFGVLFLKRNNTPLKDIFLNPDRGGIRGYIWNILLLNLAGVPPLPGFFLKIKILQIILDKIGLYAVIIFLILNFFFFFFYIHKMKSVKNKDDIKPNEEESIGTAAVTFCWIFLNFWWCFWSIYPFLCG